MRGKLIILDGIDGSGKTEQAKLLIEYLSTTNHTSKYIDFPQYNTFYGKVVSRMLKGDFGNLKNISPYLASLPFALDRMALIVEINTFLENGITVIANRYVTSNMAHQGAKFSTEAERLEYITWIEELEYSINKVPKEDMVIYLNVPSNITQKLLENRGRVADLHEEDQEYQHKVEQLYLHLADINEHWVQIECCENEEILPKEVIHEKIKNEVLSAIEH